MPITVVLEISAKFNNVKELTPIGGFDQMCYHVKLECEHCGATSRRAKKIFSGEKTKCFGKKKVHLVSECEGCNRHGYVELIPEKINRSEVVREEKKFVPVMAFRCEGLIVKQFFFAGSWCATTTDETHNFTLELEDESESESHSGSSGGEEDNEVSVSEFKSRIVLLKDSVGFRG